MVNFSKKMSLMESAKYQQRTGKKPKNIIIATEEPVGEKEVIQLYGFNLIVEKELTREEFDKLQQYNLTKSDAVQGLAPIIGAKIHIEENENIEEPPDSCKYYYKLRFAHR